MLAKINKLKNFGIYQNYTWGNIENFKKKNLIYGWNYSGKTTLSKLFQILEFKDKSKYFNGSEIQITYRESGTDKVINQNEVDKFPYLVKVFNSEYIKRIFTWDEPKTGITPITFYLGDPAGNLKSKIDKLEIINERLTALKNNKYAEIVTEFDKFNKQNGKFTEKAKEIRDNYLPGIFNPTTFNKSDFYQIAISVKDNIESHILENSERDLLKSEATAKKQFDTQNDNLRFDTNLLALANKVKNLLEDSAPQTISFPELDKNEELFNWVQTGISLHEDSENCKFCNNELSQKRIEDLNNYYSKKLQEIQSEIIQIKDEIKVERELIKIDFVNKKEISENLQSTYSNAVKNFEETKIQYEKQLDILETDLEKKGSNLFNNIPSTSIDEISFEKDFNDLESILSKHNEWIDNFQERKSKAIDKILKHYIAEYMKSAEYNLKEKNRDCALKIIKGIEDKVIFNSSQIDNYRAQLSDMVKGQRELNTILEILLHRDDIKIEIRDDKFSLERSGHPAQDLSEGEKSAIAFSYFLTELKSLRDDEDSKLSKTIIFIDDPISSLDSNHIFQIRSLLKDFLKTEDFAQLFISTHNFEFFSIMYDSNIFSRTQKEINRPLYFIKRDKEGVSTIEKMPKSFSNYKSEYAGLFHILKEFNESEDQSEFPYLLLLPNALRRFVELYTLTKYPGDNNSTVDQRVDIVFNKDEKPHHNVKLLNWFSHQNQLEKLQQHDDKIIQISDAVSDLMEYLETKDDLHWRGLNGLN